MRPISFLFIIFGIAAIFFLYMITLGQFMWWFLFYYVIVGFLSLLCLIYPRVRWWFVIGLILGVVILMTLQRHEYLQKGNSRLPF